MQVWTQIVDVLREAIFAYSQLSHGNVAYGIMIVTLLARLALLPLTLRLARSAARQQQAMRRIAPELEALRAKFRNNPRRLAEESNRLLGREGLSMFPWAGCAGALLQAPVLLAMFDAVRQSAALGGRFFWVRDISKPDVVLGMLVAALTAASMTAGPQPEMPTQQRLLMLTLPAVLTAIAMWQMAAGIGLYWGVSSVVGLAQGLIMRRDLRRERR